MQPSGPNTTRQSRLEHTPAAGWAEPGIAHESAILGYTMTLFFTAVIAGLGIGAVYGLVAVSYTIVYNSTGIFNIAQGDLMMVGVILSYWSLSIAHLPQIVTLLLIIAALILISLFEERIAVRPFLTSSRTGSMGWFISTLAFALILETIVAKMYGNNPVHPIPGVFGVAGVKVGSVSVAPKYMFAFALMIVIVAFLEYFYKHSWLGVAMRGVAEDRESAALRGIDVKRIGQLAFIIAAIVTGLAAFVVAPIVASDVTIGLTYALKGFIALAIGGFGSLRGAVVGGLILGIAEQLFDLRATSQLELLAGLAIILIVLIIRPTGIFGRRGVREV
jgi:branched-chain amino acid transport system permease protein